MYTLDLSNYFSLRLFWLRVFKKMGVLILWLLCMCEFYFILFTPNTCIKVNNYLIFFSFYFCKLLNLVFYIVTVMVEVGFHPCTGWLFSLNDIVGLYILKISLSWHHSSVLYLNLGVRFKSGIQQYVFKYPTPLHLTPYSLGSRSEPRL